MNNFDEVLEQSLDQIANDTATVEECLARNPKFSTELEPYLAAARSLVDEAAWSAAREKGRSMEFEDAAIYALEDSSG